MDGVRWSSLVGWGESESSDEIQTGSERHAQRTLLALWVIGEVGEEEIAVCGRRTSHQTARNFDLLAREIYAAVHAK